MGGLKEVINPFPTNPSVSIIPGGGAQLREVDHPLNFEGRDVNFNLLLSSARCSDPSNPPQKRDPSGQTFPVLEGLESD